MLFGQEGTNLHIIRVFVKLKWRVGKMFRIFCKYGRILCKYFWSDGWYIKYKDIVNDF